VDMDSGCDKNSDPSPGALFARGEGAGVRALNFRRACHLQNPHPRPFTPHKKRSGRRELRASVHPSC